MRWWKRAPARPDATEPASGRFRPAEGVSAASLDGRTVLLDLASERYFGLDEVGSDVWAHVQAARGAGEIAALLAAEYEAPPEQLRSDVLRYMEDLRRLGLVVPAPESS